MHRALIPLLTLIVLCTACGRDRAPTPTVGPTAAPTTPVPARPTVPPEPNPTATPVLRLGTVNDTANLRAEPSTDALVVGGAEAGTVLELVAADSSGDWYQLANGSWIAAFLIDEDLDLPVASPEEPTPAALVTATLVPGVIQATASANANLRAGPGTEFSVVGSVERGDLLNLVARNEAGDWYQMDDGSWIFGQLVEGTPGQLPVVN